MISNCCNVLLLLVSFVSVTTAAASTLKHVSLVFRHTDRSPNFIYPNDNNKESMWKDGLGWLTKLGMQRQYELGQFERQRYAGFLNVARYDHRQIDVQASALPRCLMSAYTNLAGLFPPTGEQMFINGLNWQPVPVNHAPYNDDNKLSMKAKCPRFEQLQSQVFASKAYADYLADNTDFIKNVSDATGVKSDLKLIWRLTDTLIVERNHNLTWNDWAQQPGVFDRLMEMYDYSWHFFYPNTEMARLKGGVLLKEIIDNMNTAATDKKSLLKVNMYSGHDTTVAAILRVMDVFNYKTPVMGELVMVELHNINNNDYVKVYLRNETTDDPYYLLPPGCEDPCKFSTFKTVLNKYVPEDWNAECTVQTNSGNQNGISLSVVLLLTIMIATFNKQ